MINIIFILFMLLFLFKSYFCINIKNQIIMDGDKQKVNELTMRTLGSHYGGYAYVKVKNRQADVKIDWKLLRAIEKRGGGDRQRKISSIWNRVRS